MIHDTHEQLLRGGGGSWRNSLQTLERALVPESLFARPLWGGCQGLCLPQTEVKRRGARGDPVPLPLPGVAGNHWLRDPRTIAPLFPGQHGELSPAALLSLLNRGPVFLLRRSAELSVINLLQRSL